MLQVKRKWLGALAGAAAMMLLAATAGAQTKTPGLLGQYYLVDTVATTATSPDRTIVYTPTYLSGARIDPVVDFSGFIPPGTRPNNFAIRETGYFIAPTAGDYMFTARSDDGNRLWVSTSPIDPANPGAAGVDMWVDRGVPATDDPPVSLTLTAGQKAYILYEMYQNGGGTDAHLRFQGPSDAASSIIPAADLFHDAPANAKPPTAITDLKATNPNAGGVTLTLTAPTSSDASKNATFYDVRYSTVPITAANWANASPATISSKPNAAGKPDTITVSGLQQIQHYYFAVASGDTNGNVSDLSNVADAVTSQASATQGVTAQFFSYDPSLGGSPDRTLVFDPAGQNGAPGLAYTTLVPLIDVVWPTTTGLGGAAPGVGPNKFAVRYTGTISVPTTGDYNFYTSSDDGERFWLSPNPAKIPDPNTDTADSDHWVDRGNTEDAAVMFHLTAGMKYPFVMEYYQNGGGTEVHLKWDGPGITKQTVPATAFAPDPKIPVASLGRISGQVTDGSSAGSPSINVTITGTGTNSKPNTLTSDANGIYTALVAPDSYTVTGGDTVAAVYNNVPKAPVVVTAGAAATIPTFTASLPPFFETTTAGPLDDDFTATKLDAKWTNMDIGDSTGGGAVPGMGMLNVSASGHDIYGTNDGFNFTYQKVPAGDFTVSVKLDSMPDTQDWELCGPMIRIDNADDAARAMIQVSPRHQIQLKRRATKGAATDNIDLNQALTQGSIILMPSGPGVWLKMRKVGDKVAYYWALDNKGQPGKVNLGGEWEIPDFTAAASFLVGIAATSHSASITDSGFIFEHFKYVSPLPAGGPVTPPTLLLGDPLNLGKIAIGDATFVLQVVVKLKTPTADQAKASDVDKDGDISIKDVTKILQAIVNGTGF